VLNEDEDVTVVDQEFSQPALKLFEEATDAKFRFYGAIADYNSLPTKERFDRIRTELNRTITISNSAAKFKALEEEETLALHLMLTKPMRAFVDYWQQALAIMEAGETAKISVTQEMLNDWQIASQVLITVT